MIENAEYRAGRAVGVWAKSKGFGAIFAGGFTDAFHNLDTICSSSEACPVEPKLEQQTDEPELLYDIATRALDNIESKVSKEKEIDNV